MTIRQVASILICSVCATLIATSFTTMTRWTTGSSTGPPQLGGQLFHRFENPNRSA